MFVASHFSTYLLSLPMPYTYLLTFLFDGDQTHKSESHNKRMDQILTKFTWKCDNMITLNLHISRIRFTSTFSVPYTVPIDPVITG